MTQPAAVDEVALVGSGTDEDEIDPEVAYKLRRKIDRHILPLMMSESQWYLKGYAAC